ncbi:MAG: metallophosphoesterase [Bacilli bacterium]
MKKVVRGLLAILIIVIIIGALFGIKTVKKVYEVESDKISHQINIVQISDFHSLKNYEEVVYLSSNALADFIVLTGDIFTNSNNYESTVSFIKELTQIAPVYYVNGNNDNPDGMYKQFKTEIKKLGVTVLENEGVNIKINGQELRIIGIYDNPYSTAFTENNREAKEIEDTLNDLIDKDKFNVVLSHRPQYFPQYVESGADLVLTGHTHGGMWMIPAINQGLIAPDQGFIPEYDYGMYDEKNTTMIINSGCTTRNYIPRLYNPKEVVKIELK